MAYAPQAGVDGPAGGGGFAGEASIDLVAPFALRADLRGAGDAIDVRLDGDVAGFPLRGDGAITGGAWAPASGLGAGIAPEGQAGAAPAAPEVPALSLLADVGPFTDIVLDLQGARGSGVMAGVRAGPIDVAPVPWTLDASWSAPRAALTLAGETLTVALEDGGATVRGSAAVPFAYAGDTYLLRARPADGEQRVADLTTLPLEGAIVPLAEAATAAPIATLEGTPSDLRLRVRDERGALAAALPEAWRPGGTVALDGTADLLAGPAYRADVSWTAPDGQVALRGEIAGVGADLRADAQGDGLDVMYATGPADTARDGAADGASDGASVGASGPVFHLRASEAPLERFLPPTAPAFRATIDGALTHEAATGWRGAVTLDASLASTPLPASGASDAPPSPDATANAIRATFTVLGKGEELTLEGSGAVGGVATASASGTLLPTLALAGSAQGLDGAVGATFGWTASSGLRADLDAAARSDGALSTPALHATLRWPAGADAASLTGDGIDVQLRSGVLSGGANIGITVLGQPATLEVAVDGPLADPEVRAVATAAVDEGPGAPYLTGPVEAKGSWRAATGWSAQVEAPLAASAGPLTLRAEASGTALTYDGALALVRPAEGEAGTTLLTAPFHGTGADASVVLDLATVAWPALAASAGLDADLGGGGSLTVTTRPLAVAFEADLTGTVEGAAVALTGRAPDDLRLVVDGAGFRLDGRLAWTEDRTAELRGELDGRAIDARFTLDDPADRGALEIAVGDARLRATLEPETDGAARSADGSAPLAARSGAAPARRLVVDVDVPAGALGRVSGSARAVVILGGADGAQDEARDAGQDGLAAAPAGPAGAAGISTARLAEFSARIDGLIGPVGADRASTMDTGAPPPADAAEAVDAADAAGAHPVYLEGAGALTPALDVRGVVRVPSLGEAADVEVRDGTLEDRAAEAPSDAPGGPAAGATGAAAGPIVDVRWDGLRARYDVTGSTLLLTGGTSIDTSGPYASAYAAILPDVLAGASAALSDAALRWSATAGFDGGARVTLAAPAWERFGPIDVTLHGHGSDGGADGGLTLEAAPRVPADAPFAGMQVELRADLTADPLRDPNLTGQLLLDVPLDAVAGAPDLPDLRLVGTPALGGTLLAPTLDGDVALNGFATARGPLHYADGVAGLRLDGPAVQVSVDAADGGWEAEVHVDDLPLDEVLPQVVEPRLSLTARAEPGLGGAVQVHVEHVALTAPNSSLVGGATLVGGAADGGGAGRDAGGGEGGSAGSGTNGGVKAALQAQLDLTDLRLGDADLRGLVRGPVVLTAPSPSELGDASVTALLDAARLGIAGFDGSVSGTLQLGGSLAAPFLTTALQGDGAVRGGIRLDAAPAAGRLDLTSDLALGPVVSDLRIAVQDGAASARGSVRVGEAVVVFDDDEDGITAAGVGRLDGWQARIAPDLSAASVDGDLSAAVRGASGRVRLAFLAGAPDVPWFAGEVTDAVLLEQPLGTITLAAASPGAPITLDGAHLRGSFDPSQLRWDAVVEALPTTLGPALDLTAEGAGVRFRIDGSLHGADEQGALPLDLAFHYVRADDIELRMGGGVAGGTFDALATRVGAAPWQGDVRLEGAAFAGVAVSAEGGVQGTDLLPQVVLRTRVGGPVSVEGRASLGIGGITLDQTLQGGPLTAPVRVQGRILPFTDLTIVSGPALAGTVTPPDAGVTSGAGASAPGTTSTLRLRAGGAASGALHAVGAVDVHVGPLRLRLDGRGPSGTPYLRASLPTLPNVAAETSLAATNLAALATRVAEGGLTLEGTGAASGTLSLRTSPEVGIDVHDFQADAFGFLITADGEVTAARADLAGTLALPAGLPLEDVLPWQVSLQDGRWELLSDGALGRLQAVYDAAGEVLLDADVRVGGGRVEGRATFRPDVGPSGSVRVTDVRVAPTGVGTMVLGADATIADGRIGGRATVDVAGGRVSASGSWGLADLVPAELAPGAPTGGNVEVRVRTVELAEVAGVARLLPHLQGALSGVVQLRDGLVLGQLLLPELEVGERTLPATLSLSGGLRGLDASLNLGRSLISATIADGVVAGTARLELLPLDLLAEAALGDTDVTAELTGVMRFEVPLADPGAGYLRLASEEIRLERAGVVTLGDVAIAYQDGAVQVERAAFEGRGAWQASGTIGADLLDFDLEATDADFTPLLGLAPSLARLGIGARGSFTFRAGGSLATPDATFESETLEVELGGGTYRLDGAQVTLDGVTLRGSAQLAASGAVTGALEVAASGRLALQPVAVDELDVRFGGTVGLPGIGTVEEVNGTVRQVDGAPRLDVSGTLGSPLRVEGALFPLDLRAGGTGLRLAFPSLLIASAVVDADLSLRTAEDGLALGGDILAQEVVIDPAVRPAPVPSAAPGAGKAAAPASVGEAAPPTSSADGTEGSGPTGVRFDQLSIRAPQRVLLSTNLGAGEAALDLVLGGTSSDPQLAGEARALRGSLRFSGRDFTLERAIASFQPSRGVLPELDVAAYTEFDQQRALGGLPGVRFVQPSGASPVRVDLAFAGPVERAPQEQGGIRFDVRPVLTSEALIEVSGEGAGAGVRSLTQPELLSLVTLGRLELNAEVIGAGGLGEAVAQGALDTAVDLLIVSELQNALREALGLDVVEIRTSALSTLLDAGAQPFGVSVRLGGYLAPELFASYRIGTYDGSDRTYAVTNEVALSYALGPLDLDLFGRFDLPTAGTLAQPRSELGVGVSYAFGRTVRLETGVSLATDRSAVHFGVTLRW